MRFYIISGVILSLMTAAVVGVYAAPNDTQPALSMIVNAKSCEPACWQSIRPGFTTFSQGKAIVASDPVAQNIELREGVSIPGKPKNSLCWDITATVKWNVCIVSMSPTSRITYLKLTPTQGRFTLGDAIAILGVPVQQDMCGFASTRNGQLMATGYVYFNRHTYVTIPHGAYQPAKITRLSPHMPIEAIYISGFRTGSQRLWQGFKRDNSC